jgi:hypothetical protein
VNTSKGADDDDVSGHMQTAKGVNTSHGVNTSKGVNTSH